ncbi:unnamed protein product [Fraxinus pennsylvanica]|uniref:Uncharacterized protein n=1 Tax=Fraxinus pennsylvanica TaxID=56036 RepID=A0AAD1ZZ99_9LAMI|nr:unnamed protein product [Fraxinus pennsylvanica]
MEYQESLKPSAIISKLSDPVKTRINNFLANGVMSSGKVIGSILLLVYELFRVEELAISSSANLIDHNRLQIYKHSPRDVFSMKPIHYCLDPILPSAMREFRCRIRGRCDTGGEGREIEKRKSEMERTRS